MIICETVPSFVRVWVVGMDASRNLGALKASLNLVMVIHCQRWGFIGSICTTKGKWNVMYMTHSVTLNDLAEINRVAKLVLPQIQMVQNTLLFSIFIFFFSMRIYVYISIYICIYIYIYSDIYIYREKQRETDREIHRERQRERQRDRRRDRERTKSPTGASIFAVVTATNTNWYNNPNKIIHAYHFRRGLGYLVSHKSLIGYKESVWIWNYVLASIAFPVIKS